jgi:peptidoglycan hydrolase-like protein with peptidoglycan-binding domain
MTIAKDFASKAGIAFVALAMIFTMSVPASNAQTQTPEDLQKMIDTLMAQIEALKGGTASATASGYTWTRDLKTGATGADVMELQKFLNSNEDTRVAATGVGSAGMETSYFGPATAAAVSKFQMKYRADILSPAGLVNPTGFFGPSTRAKANALNTVTTPTPDEDEDGSTDEDEKMKIQLYQVRLH